MCCGRYELDEEKHSKLTRRQLLKSLGLGVSTLALAGLTGCISLFGRGGKQSGELTQEAYSIAGQSLKDLARGTKSAWKQMIKTYLEIECPIQSRQLRRIKNLVRQVRSRTVEFAIALESSGISKEFDKQVALLANDPEKISFQAIIDLLEGLISGLTNGKPFLEGDLLLKELSQDFKSKDRRRRAFNHILEQGGPIRGILRIMRGFEADELIERIKTKCSNESAQIIIALDSDTCKEECEDAKQLAVSLAGIASIICSLTIVYPELQEECEAALTAALAAAAAAAIICCLCGGGCSGNERITP
jgi:hypothetical protein